MGLLLRIHARTRHPYTRHSRQRYCLKGRSRPQFPFSQICPFQKSFASISCSDLLDSFACRKTSLLHQPRLILPVLGATRLRFACCLSCVSVCPVPGGPRQLQHRKPEPCAGRPAAGTSQAGGAGDAELSGTGRLGSCCQR